MGIAPATGTFFSLRKIGGSINSQSNILQNQILDRALGHSLNKQAVVALDLDVAESDVADSANAGPFIALLNVYVNRDNIVSQPAVDGGGRVGRSNGNV